MISTYTVGHPQIDGRRYVKETHTDDVGVVHEVEYLAAIGTDYQAVMDARAVVLAVQLQEAEADALINDGT